MAAAGAGAAVVIVGGSDQFSRVSGLSISFLFTTWTGHETGGSGAA